MDNHRRCGRVNGEDILLDMGADISVVAAELLDQDYSQRGSVMLKPIASKAIKCPATMVPVELGRRSFVVREAVMPRRELGCHLILGRNVPEVPLQQLAAETLPVTRGDQSRGDRPRSGQARGQQTDCGAPSGVDTDATPQPVGAPEEEAQPSTEDQQQEEPAQANRLQLINIVTKAQLRRQRQTETENDRATEESEADISSWERIKVLEPDKDDHQGNQTPDEEDLGVTKGTQGQEGDEASPERG